ncbi:MULTISPECIES: hypothetical protein [unclassified Streptomyces]|uniref:hypothetical protein n=1 Tax=unclassified Streptomyces TaxID=2593676 RepID=UPI0024764E4A|nr:hypothetical protein [Streptomyces sp. SAI-119]MDH6455476.1 hypothetical protein [Streptomyces sp. SAI-119]
MSEDAAASVNIFTLDEPSATGASLLRAAASFTAETARGLSAGFNLQAEFQAAVDAKLSDAVTASFRTAESASISAEASAYFPVDLFSFAGVIASLKVQAEAKASVGLDVSLRPAALLDAVLAEHADDVWLPYVEVVARQFWARAGVQASAAVCVKATAETKIGLRLFPSGKDGAGTVFVINYGYGFIYGYSWGLTAELALPDPPALVRSLLQVTAGQLRRALEAESRVRAEPVKSALAAAADLVELAVPALAGMVCTLLTDEPGTGRDLRLRKAAVDLGLALGRFLVERAVEAATTELGRLIEDLGLPVEVEVGNQLRRLLQALQTVVVGGPRAVLPVLIDEAVGAVLTLVSLATAEADRERVADVAIGIWAGVGLLVPAAAGPAVPSGALRRLLVGVGVDPAAGDPADLPAHALAAVASRLLRRAGAAKWLGDVTGLSLAELLLLARRGFAGDAATVLGGFLGAVGDVLSRELLDELPQDTLGLPPETVQSVRSLLRVAVEELPGLLGDVDRQEVVARLRERVSVGLLQTVAPPLLAYIERLAHEAFDQAVPAVRRLEAAARDAGDLVPAFPPGGPLERFTTALSDFGREFVDVTVGLPTSVLLGHLATKLERWRDIRLPVELELMRSTLCMTGQTSEDLLARLDRPRVAVVAEALLSLLEHHLDQIRSMTVFIIEDSFDLTARLTVLPFEQAARLFAATIRLSFKATAALIALLTEAADELNERLKRLQDEAGLAVGRIAEQCGALADRAAEQTDDLINQVITDLVGNDPVARFAAQLAFDALTGGMRPVLHRALADTAVVLRVAGESITAAARAGTLADGDVAGILHSAVTATASQGVSIPITILVPIIPPFWFETITITTVRVPAEWLGQALWSALTAGLGVKPILDSISDTAASLKATNAALDAIRSAGSPDALRERAELLRRQAAAAYLGEPITIEFAAGPPQSVTTATTSFVVRGHVTGIDRSYIAPTTVADASGAVVIPPRVRFTCQGVTVAYDAVDWTDAGPHDLAFAFRVSTRPEDPALRAVTVRPGLCIISAVAAAGAWNGHADTTGAGRSLTLFLAPAAARDGGQLTLAGWRNAAGRAHLVYAAEPGRLCLLTRDDDRWTPAMVERVTPRPASGLLGWSDPHDTPHLIYAAAAGGVREARATKEPSAPIEVDPAPTRIGRPQRFVTPGGTEHVAYVDEAGHLRVARRDPGGAWAVTDLTAAALAPPAAAAGGLAGWTSAVSADADLVAEGNLLRNPAFADDPRNRWEDAAYWTRWTQNHPGTVMVTDLRRSTLPSPLSTRMIHVGTTVPHTGLVQTFLPDRTGPDAADAAAWVYLLRGEVAIGTGNGGSTGYDARTSARGRWLRLAARNGTSPANEFIVYASSAGGAEFFVAGASVRRADAEPVAGAWNLAYGGADGHLHQLAFAATAGTWQAVDVTAVSGAPAWRADTDPAGWAGDLGEPHLAFWGADGQRYEAVGPASGIAAGTTASGEWTVRLLGPPRLGGRTATRHAAATWSGPDGRLLATTSGDDTLELLRATPDGWVARAPAEPPMPATRESVVGWADPDGDHLAVIGAGRTVVVATHDHTGWSVADLSASGAPRASGREEAER